MRIFYKIKDNKELDILKDSKIVVCDCTYNKGNVWVISYPTCKVHGLGRICANDPEWFTPSMLLEKAKAIYPDLVEVFSIEEFIKEAKKNQEGINFNEW